MATAVDVARYLVELASRDAVPDELTPVRLQCLLVYAQGWHLGAFDQTLFPEPLLTGPKGPHVHAVTQVIETVLGSDPARGIRSGDLGAHALSFREKQFVAAIWEKYREYSAPGLITLLAQEGLGLASALAPSETNSIAEIPADTLCRHFRRRDELRGFNPTEWESVTQGEEELARGEGIPWTEAKRRWRERQLPTHPVAGSLPATPGGSAVTSG
jgi:uncharacterized phage-associated protein